MKICTETQISRREERRLERRRAILDVATPSFLENGYDGTTMSEISAKLGGSRGTLWNHFPSKEELFAAFLDQKTAVFQLELRAALEPVGKLRPALEIFVKRYIEKMSLPTSIKLYRLIVSEGGRSPEIARMFYERGPGAVEAILGEFFSDHLKAGNLRSCDPVEAARHVTTMCMGGHHKRLLIGCVKIDAATIAAEASGIVTRFLQVYGPIERLTEPNDVAS